MFYEEKFFLKFAKVTGKVTCVEEACNFIRIETLLKIFIRNQVIKKLK